MLPFSVHLVRGKPAHAQILEAVREAFASGQLRDGDRFPSARVMTQELKVSPATTQRVVDQLIEDGFLTQLRGSGLMVRTGAPAKWVSELRARQEQDFQASTVVENLEPAALAVQYPFLTPSDRPEVLGLIDSHEVLRLIARGGMGMVFEALDRGLMRKVAIKVLVPELAASAESRTRFLREARAVAAIDHENVLPIYAVGEANGCPYLVMPLVAGESLQVMLKRKGPLPLEDLHRISLAAAKGLAAAHERNLIHRDIKPDNVLLEEGEEGRVWLADFGLARAVHDLELTRTGVMAGTPQFTSPEQAEGVEIDLRADLFSFGSLMYAMATGAAPFLGENPLVILRKIIDEAPKPVSEARPDLPEPLPCLIMKLLEKKPENRLSGAPEIVSLLESMR